ncbi:LLM class F420-dependent oxidoreductase [Micromonospora sp. WMMA1947]|uniref:LLM class F420-dependent oxidoreductase n=1 Tax=Micromonospora sp. WMMA1947 TaxID=3015163 RepID=UPI00248C7ABE|nr:LLM class F420-dependent oxidoreductase [Micromonospora sp. WMMA1947]WBC07484.1 LLM class F420-dependent oxidoreductase [Micromonospora sp. WMMA1947]
MQLGLSLPTVGPPGRRRYLIDVAEAADELGFHSLWISSHVALPKQRDGSCLYPRAKTADAYNWGVAWLEPLTLMGLVAGVTERIKVGTHVLALPYRNPVILASELATLDQLSLGRIILGAGLGWMDEEFAIVGVPRRQRGARTDEYIEVMRTLWRGKRPVSFHGRFVDFDDMWLAARPHSEAGPPVFVGGNTEHALRRVARLGEGWLAHELYPDEILAARETLARLSHEAGRDPAEIMVTVRRGLVPPFPVMDFMSDRISITGSAEEVAAQFDAYRDAGVSLLVLDLSMRPAEMIKTMEWLVEEVATVQPGNDLSTPSGSREGM